MPGTRTHEYTGLAAMLSTGAVALAGTTYGDFAAPVNGGPDVLLTLVCPP